MTKNSRWFCHKKTDKTHSFAKRGGARAQEYRELVALCEIPAVEWILGGENSMKYLLSIFTSLLVFTIILFIHNHIYLYFPFICQDNRNIQDKEKAEYRLEKVRKFYNFSWITLCISSLIIF
jgi:hypothetical protein